MAYTDNISRLSRLTAILLKLQTRPFVSVQSLSEEFEVSTRTIYRDLTSLEQAGVPLVSEEGRGYRLMSGYNVPPVMFTEQEANALIIAEKFIAKSKDKSLIRDFNKAIDKIKSVLLDNEKEKVDLLADRIIIGKNWDEDISSSYLADIKHSLTNYSLLHIHYQKNPQAEMTERNVEPFAIYLNTQENWILIAWCRWRNDFRTFRVDKIKELRVMDEKFSPHDLSLEEYVERVKKRLGRSD
ncbi:MAG: WYL domain-containing protein [Bacteroidia bacterium]|nr:WYL domain-containing protein [Bacteroidia bacterium]